MTWKLALAVVMVLTESTIICEGAFANEHHHNNGHHLKKMEHPKPKYTIEELLHTTYPYTDPRTDYQLDMDPCKSGEFLLVIRLLKSPQGMLNTLRFLYVLI